MGRGAIVYHIIRPALLVVLTLFLVNCSPRPEQVVDAASPKGAAKGTASKTAPNFTLKDSDGRAVSLTDYKGKVVLLNFWATWCGPCKIEIPWFVEFEQKYKDRGFAVLGVSMDEDGWEVVKPYLAKSKINYRILLGNDDVAKQYGGVESLPTTLVIDRTGTIHSKHEGLVSKSEYEKDIMALLGAAR
jgi:peroxiredoxin